MARPKLKVHPLPAPEFRLPERAYIDIHAEIDAMLADVRGDLWRLKNPPVDKRFKRKYGPKFTEGDKEYIANSDRRIKDLAQMFRCSERRISYVRAEYRKEQESG
jgi:hypothetical protein